MTSMWLYFVIGALVVVLAYLYWQEQQEPEKEGFYPGWYGGGWRRPGWGGGWRRPGWGGGWRRPGWWGGSWGPYPYRPYPYY
jgi:hypothetical protein